MIEETILCNRDRSVFGKAFIPDLHGELLLPLFGNRVAAGFPSPATDYIEETINLNKDLIANPASTFFIKVMGESMLDAYIRDSDLLVVDASLKPRNGCTVVCLLDGEFTVKTYRTKGKQVFLEPANPQFSPILLTESMDVEFYGVVTYSIHDCKRPKA